MQKLFFKKVLVTLLAVLSLNNLKALTYYISPSGNNNADGASPGTAWQSISKLNTITLLPGTQVLFEAGQSFPGSIYLDAGDGNDISNPIIISSYGTGKAIIQSAANTGLFAYNTKGFQISNLIFEGSGLYVNSTDGIKIFTDLGGNIKLGNIKITGVEIRQYGVKGLSIYASYSNTGFKDVLIDQVHVHHVKETGIFIGGYTAQNHTGWSHQNIIVKNSEMDNIPGYADPSTHRGSGIIMAQVDNGVIEKSVAHHNGAGNTHCGGPGGIWVYDCNNIIVQRCESYSNSSGSGCDGLGFDLDGGVTNSTLQYNYSHDNDGAGYLLGQYDNARPWTNNVVRYNISENDGRTNAGGITLFKGANTVMNGCKIYNNTIYTSPSTSNPNVGAFTIINWNTGMTGIEVYNNIFQTTGGASLIDIPNGYDAFFAGNLYWSSGGNFKIRYHGTIYSSIAAWRTATGNEKVNSTITGITADPLLNNVGNGGVLWPAPTYSLNAYKTQAGSPANNAALNLSSMFAINTGAIDFFNSALAASNIRGIGAYEKSSSLATSIEDKNASDVNISYYPNPVLSGEYIHLSGGEGPYKIELFSISGALVAEEIVKGSEYYVQEGRFATGIYIIRINGKNENETTGKLIIK
ncbi:MAG: T9SS type A sorting domain-containing protein [Burkholderiales bacterium]|nr:T9SS type A sorting domain-containing protein [Bacteroidia bacterium]